MPFVTGVIVSFHVITQNGLLTNVNNIVGDPKNEIGLGDIHVTEPP